MGFYSDPSICQVGDNYYLINSTFVYFPGIPIFHSKDLVNWEQIGHVLDRPEQLQLDGFGVSRGIFAPAISYFNGIYYVTCTLVDGGGNFVVTSDNPAGPWSNPVWLPEVSGIDPSLFFDSLSQKAYIVYNSDAPNNEPLYDGHRTIRMYEFDYDSLKVNGENIILVNGGTDLSKQPIWIEGPHIFKKDGYYYLIAAEGGTGDNHSEVVFRSKNVDGPYESYQNNPILTQRDLDPDRLHPITSTGHADFVTTESGDWWAVFLGCRPYEGNYYNTGRETFMAPVVWEDGWPIINPEYREVQYYYPFPEPTSFDNNAIPHSGNFTFRDEFEERQLAYNWVFLRTPKEKWYSLQESTDKLEIKLLPETCSGKSNPAFIGHRQQHLIGSASISMEFEAEAANEMAGLLVFQNESHFYYLAKTILNNTPVLHLYKSDSENVNGTSKLTSSEMISLSKHPLEDANSDNLFLRVNFNKDQYSFDYSYDNELWNTLIADVDGKFLSTQEAGGFVGTIVAMYATSNYQSSSNTAIFDWFEYSGNDEMYR